MEQVRSSFAVALIFLVFAAVGCGSNADRSATTPTSMAPTTTSTAMTVPFGESYLVGTERAAPRVVGLVAGHGGIDLAYTAPDGSIDFYKVPRQSFGDLCSQSVDYFYSDCSVAIPPGSKVIVDVTPEGRDNSLIRWSISGAGSAAAVCAQSGQQTCSFAMPDNRVEVAVQFTANSRMIAPTPAAER